ncbi:tyrosine-type recombinase/integrase [Spirillospora sp. CA-294931]|uniref:tyrosine-type recombinase/integrase n=1 Tax=Spirillospora sp. CA-294931 TaxID=3240042 RepID=UPI003D8F3625
MADNAVDGSRHSASGKPQRSSKRATPPRTTTWRSATRMISPAQTATFSAASRSSNQRLASALTWGPRELRHTFALLMSGHEFSDEEISDLVSHSSTQTTRSVYRHQLRPIVRKDSEKMNEIFKDEQDRGSLTSTTHVGPQSDPHGTCAGTHPLNGLKPP